ALGKHNAVQICHPDSLVAHVLVNHQASGTSDVRGRRSTHNEPPATLRSVLMLGKPQRRAAKHLERCFAQENIAIVRIAAHLVLGVRSFMRPLIVYPATFS